MAELSEMRVMVVDDTKANVDILLELLGDQYKVVVATDGQMALEDVRRHPPDLILLDIMMPGIDGYTVCRRLKETPATRDIPVIFLTALKEAGHEARGLALGAVDYIIKPFNPELVKARVRNHLDLKRHRDHLEAIVDTRTRELAERQRIEYELRTAKAKIENELSIAAEIQTNFLPSCLPAFPEHPEFDLSAMMRPAREVGGDFYDFFLPDPDHLMLLIADVSDKGIPAALYMMVSRTLFRSLSRHIESPAGVLAETNKLLCEENDTGMFVTAFLVRYHFASGRLTFANAGHHPAIRIDPDAGPLELTGKHGLALGLMAATEYEETRTRLAPGQTLFLYTDGVTEALTPDNEMYGLKRLLADLHILRKRGLTSLLRLIDQGLTEFQQDRQFDDITMLALRRKGGGGLRN